MDMGSLHSPKHDSLHDRHTSLLVVRPRKQFCMSASSGHASSLMISAMVSLRFFAPSPLSTALASSRFWFCSCRVSCTYQPEAHIKNTVLDRLLHGQLPDVDSARLAQPVRAVERLVLESGVSSQSLQQPPVRCDSRRVPPEVHQHDIVAAREVETRAARLEADENDAVLGTRADRLQHVLSLVGGEGAVVCCQLLHDGAISSQRT